METALTVRTVEFTETEKADAAGAIFERVELKFISSTAGAAFCTAALTYWGTAGGGATAPEYS
jgi:hypothetical protein